MSDALLPRPIVHLAMDELRSDVQGRHSVPDRADPRVAASTGAETSLVADDDVGVALKVTGSRSCWVELPWTSWKERLPSRVDDTTWKPANLTLCAWVKLTAPAAGVTPGDALVGLRSGGSSTFGFAGGVELAVEVPDDKLWQAGEHNVGVDEWVHVALTVQDCVHVSRWVGATPGPSGQLSRRFELTAPRLVVGCAERDPDQPASRSVGLVAGVRLYDCVLTFDELQRVASLDKPAAGLAAPGARYPIRFVFRGSGDKPALHFGSIDPRATAATIELINDAPDMLVVQEPTADSVVSAENHHMAVTFRPGVLDAAAAPAIDPASTDWTGQWVTGGHGGGVLYLLARDERQLPRGARASVSLVGLVPSSDAGARSTQVRFEHRQMHLAGARADLVGDRHQVLSLLEESASDLARDVADLQEGRSGALDALGSHVHHLEQVLDELRAGEAARHPDVPANVESELNDMKESLQAIQTANQQTNAALLEQLKALRPAATPLIEFSIANPTILLADGQTRQTVTLAVSVRPGETVFVPREGGRIVLTFLTSDGLDAGKRYGAAGTSANIAGLVLDQGQPGWMLEPATSTSLESQGSPATRTLVPAEDDVRIEGGSLSWPLNGLWGDADQTGLGPIRIHVKLENAGCPTTTDELPTEWMLTVPTGAAQLDHTALKVVGWTATFQTGNLSLGGSKNASLDNFTEHRSDSPGYALSDFKLDAQGRHPSTDSMEDTLTVNWDAHWKKVHVDSSLLVSGPVTAKEGLTVPSGKPVAGIPVIVFRRVHLTQQHPGFSKANGVGQWHWKWTESFESDVASAEVVLEGFFLNWDRDATLEALQVAPEVMKWDGKTVSLEAWFGWRDFTKNWDDALGANTHLDVLVIATLRHSI